MSDPPHMPPVGSIGHRDSASPIDKATPPPLSPNVLTGIVFARTEGLTCTTYRIRVAERIDVRMRWPSSSCRSLSIGRPVRLMIPQESVLLEAGGFRRGKQRWNRWIGRVVLSARQDKDGSITVKIHHAPITLKSRGSVTGTQSPLSTWDTVNVVVDPQHITILPGSLPAPQLQRPNTGLPDSRARTETEPNTSCFLTNRMLRSSIN